MRAVIDTNVLLSGLLWRGAPHTLVEQVRNGTLILVSSPDLMVKLAGVMARPKFRAVLGQSNIDPREAVSEMRLLSVIVDPQPLATPFSRDRDDDAVLALAAAARPDLIISGDLDLVVLGDFDGIPIVTPSQALVLIQA